MKINIFLKVYRYKVKYFQYFKPLRTKNKLLKSLWLKGNLFKVKGQKNILVKFKGLWLKILVKFTLHIIYML